LRKNTYSDYSPSSSKLALYLRTLAPALGGERTEAEPDTFSKGELSRPSRVGRPVNQYICVTKNASKVFSLDHLLDRDLRCEKMQVAKYGHVGWGGGMEGPWSMCDDEGKYKL